MHGIPEDFPFQSLPIHAPEILVIRIYAGVSLLVILTRHLVDAREHDQPVHRFNAPAPLDELSRQPIQQFRMRRWLSPMPKIVWSAHKAPAKVPLPNPVDH